MLPRSTFLSMMVVRLHYQRVGGFVNFNLMLRSPLILTLSSRLQAVFVVCDKIPQPIKVLLVIESLDLNPKVLLVLSW